MTKAAREVLSETAVVLVVIWFLQATLGGWVLGAWAVLRLFEGGR